MSQVLIVTDTVSGLSAEIAAQYGLRVVPGANIVFDGRSYPDGLGITPGEAYQFLQKDPDKFTASTLTPSYLLELLRDIAKDRREIVFLTFSSALSAANRIAGVAADLLKKESPAVDIRVIDSKTVAGSLGLLAIAAAKQAAAGKTIDEIEKYVAEVRPKVCGIMMLDTLRYVYRTGRYSKTTAIIASIFQIKPINKVNLDGTMSVMDKVRKRQDGYDKVFEIMRKEAGTDALHFMVSHASAPEMAEEFVRQLREHFNCLSVVVSEYSPIMGYAAGPRCLYIGYHPELA